MKMDAVRFSKMMVLYHNTTWHQNPEDHYLNEINAIISVLQVKQLLLPFL